MMYFRCRECLLSTSLYCCRVLTPSKQSNRWMVSFLMPKTTTHCHGGFGHEREGSKGNYCTFQNVTSRSAPYLNFHLRTCTNRSLTADNLSMQGSHSYNEGSGSSRTENALLIQNFLKAYRDPDDLKSALDQSKILLDEDLVLNILRRNQSDWNCAFLFFNWASDREGYSHGTCAYSEMLDILGRMKCFELMRKLVDEIPQEKRMSVVTDRTFAILLNRYASGHKVEEAIEMFYRRPEFGLELDNSAFQRLLMSLCRYKHVEAAESLFLLKQREFPPDIKSRNIILNGWCVTGRLREARRFWNDIISSGCKPDRFTYGTFINALSKGGKLSRAKDLFSSMGKKGCPPDVPICNCIIDALCFKKKIPDAFAIFYDMNERGCRPDVATYNTLIKYLSKIGRMEKSYQLLDEMEQSGCTPNTRTYGFFFKSMKKPEEVPLMQERMERNGCRMMADTYNLILKLFIKWNDMDKAQSIWLDMEKNGMGPDQRSYTIMIHGLYNQGKMAAALHYFIKMTSKGMIPEPRTRLLIKAIEFKRAENSDALTSMNREKKTESDLNQDC